MHAFPPIFAIVARLARATLGDAGIDWAGMERDYDVIREHISKVIPGFQDYNSRIRLPGGFALPNAPRDKREFRTATGRAMFTVRNSPAHE